MPTYCVRRSRTVEDISLSHMLISVICTSVAYSQYLDVLTSCGTRAEAEVPSATMDEFTRTWKRVRISSAC